MTATTTTVATTATTATSTTTTAMTATTTTLMTTTLKVRLHRARFRGQFCTKLARLVIKTIFLAKRVSLMQNRGRNLQV